jgi:putative membrane protein
MGGERQVMYGPWDGGWWGFGMMLFSLLFLALIVVGVVFVVRSFSGAGRTAPRSQGNRALDILDERFARGEIDQQEYEERRRILTGGR